MRSVVGWYLIGGSFLFLYIPTVLVSAQQIIDTSTSPQRRRRLLFPTGSGEMLSHVFALPFCQAARGGRGRGTIDLQISATLSHATVTRVLNKDKTQHPKC